MKREQLVRVTMRDGGGELHQAFVSIVPPGTMTYPARALEFPGWLRTCDADTSASHHFGAGV